MNESGRTGLYIVIGMASLLIAWWAKPATIERNVVDDSGERFFEPFDLLDAASLEIVTFDDATSTRNVFQVARKDGVWTIPSHENYPADASDRVAQAAAAVMGLKKGLSKSDSPSDHELYGVIDPKTADDVVVGAGTRVTLQNDAGRVLVDLIIGSADKDLPHLRYVRVPGRDRVYTTQINVSSLTTRFEDWIERDLLKLTAGEITEVFIRDYSIDELQNRVINRDLLQLQYDSSENAWSLNDLGEGEEVNSQKLNELRFALDNLQIVDVRKKPADFSAQLASGEGLKLDSEAVNSLASRGFYIVNNQLMSNEGELAVRTMGGVEYILRFGEVVRFDAGTDLENAPDSIADQSNESGRYVFVTARFADGAIPEPDIIPVPEDNPESEENLPEEARQAIIKSNEQRRQDYEQKIQAGRDKAKELSERFADWYYVVSDDVYQKVRLRRDDIIQPAEEPSEISE